MSMNLSTKRRAPKPPLLERSVSMQEDEPVEPPVMLENQYGATAPASLIGRWKMSIKRKITGSPAGSVKDPEEQATTYDVVNVLSFDEPLDESFDSSDTEPAISVKVCRDSIRNNVFEMMRDCNGDVKILEAMEQSLNSVNSLLKTASPAEKQVAFLWAAYLKRKDFLALLVRDVDLNTATPSDGLSALHLAAFSGSADCVRFLLNAGAKCTKPQSLSTLHCAALGNSTDCIKMLMASGASVNDTPNIAEPEDSPLHYAVRANAPDCVEQLIAAGADVNRIGEGGLTPLHVATELGFTDCMKQILKSGKNVDVNAKTQDRRGHSALHLAAEEEWAEAIKLLLSHNADALCRNLRGQTPLHVAARVQSVECIKVLLIRSDVNAGDSDKRTPLHVAVGKSAGAAETVEVLCKAPGVDVNIADRYGHTPLHVAALNELPSASAVLIRNGADLSARTKRGVTALNLVTRKARGCLYAIEEVLDSSIKIIFETNRDREVELKLDFRPLLQSNRSIEVSLLSTFIKEGHPEILQHPLCQAFLHLKWETIRKFYFARLFLSFLFLLCLSLYALMFLTNDCHNEINKYHKFNISMKRLRHVPAACENDTYLFGYKRTDDLYPYISSGVRWTLFALTLVEILRKVYGLIAALSAPTILSFTSALKAYVFEVDNALEWFTLVSVPLVLNIFWRETQGWQAHLGAFAVLAGWANLMIMVGQLPLFGAYVSMYTCVLREFIKLLGAYICLLIGFAISFCVIFHTAPDFSNPLIALVKVLVMMTGELEFKDLLIDEDNSTTHNSTGTQTVFEGKFLDFSAHVIFVLCLLFLTVAMMNLLVGIAVHDIQGLRASAGLAKLERQADLIGYVETALSGCCSCSNVFSTKLRCVHNTKQRRSNSTIMHIKPYNSMDSRLPREIVKLAYETAKRKESYQKSRPNTFNRLSDTSSLGLFTVPRKPSVVSDARRLKRTVYIKNTEKQPEAESETETAAALKQLGEEVSELREALATNQAMLRQLIQANEPIVPRS